MCLVSGSDAFTSLPSGSNWEPERGGWLGSYVSRRREGAVQSLPGAVRQGPAVFLSFSENPRLALPPPFPRGTLHSEYPRETLAAILGTLGELAFLGNAGASPILKISCWLQLLGCSAHR